MLVNFWSAVLLSLALGSIIGIERQWHRRLVDLKTNALVSLGACLFMLVTKSDQGYTDSVRMAAQIVVGVGFIGGGLLFRDGSQTKGINTAATMWCCAAVGVMCGLDRWIEATMASLVIVTANTLLRHMAQYLNLKMGIADSLTDAVRFDFDCAPGDVATVQSQALEFFKGHTTDIRSVSRQNHPDQSTTLSLTVYFEHADFGRQADLLVEAAQAFKARGVSWTRL